MNFSICARCEAPEFETKFSVCMNCNYGLDNDAGGEIPIPAWVLKHIDVTPAELVEIREINFGFRPRSSSAPKQENPHEESIATPVLAERRPIPFPFGKHWQRPAFDTLETGQCVM